MLLIEIIKLLWNSLTIYYKLNKNDILGPYKLWFIHSFPKTCFIFFFFILIFLDSDLMDKLNFSN